MKIYTTAGCGGCNILQGWVQGNQGNRGNQGNQGNQGNRGNRAIKEVGAIRAIRGIREIWSIRATGATRTIRACFVSINSKTNMVDQLFFQREILLSICDIS